MTDIVYVKHPVAAELKAEIRAKGLKIIDARFAPEGAEIINTAEEASDEPKEGTVDWLKLRLDEKGIDYSSDAKKADLEKLLADV